MVAARTASSRLPGKALLPLGGQPMILFLLERLRALQAVQIILATTTLASDDRLAEVVGQAGIPVFRGAAEDLVQRYCDVAAHYGLDTLIRVTADCPFLDADLLQWCMDRAAEKADWALMTTKGAFPVGLDAEIFPASVMRKLNSSGCLTAADREHLTLHMYNNAYRVEQIAPPDHWPKSAEIFTVDTPEDYRRALNIVDAMQCGDFSVEALLLR